MAKKEKKRSIFSRKLLPRVFWPRTVSYLLTITLIITAGIGIVLQFFPESESLAKLNRGVLQSPFSHLSHLNLGKYYLSQGNLDEAQKELEVASVLGSTEALQEYTAAAGKPQQIRQEIAFWEAQVKKKPGYRDAHIQLASLYYQLQDMAKAKIYLEKARQIDPNYPEVQELDRLLQ